MILWLSGLSLHLRVRDSGSILGRRWRIRSGCKFRQLLQRLHGALLSFSHGTLQYPQSVGRPRRQRREAAPKKGSAQLQGLGACNLVADELDKDKSGEDDEVVREGGEDVGIRGEEVDRLGDGVDDVGEARPGDDGLSGEVGEKGEVPVGELEGGVAGVFKVGGVVGQALHELAGEADGEQSGQGIWVDRGELLCEEGKMGNLSGYAWVG